MGSFIIKSKNSHEEIEVYFDDGGNVFKIELYSPLLNREVILDLRYFISENPKLYHQWCVRAAEELQAGPQSEPNPAA